MDRVYYFSQPPVKSPPPPFSLDSTLGVGCWILGVRFFIFETFAFHAVDNLLHPRFPPALCPLSPPDQGPGTFFYVRCGSNPVHPAHPC